MSKKDKTPPPSIVIPETYTLDLIEPELRDPWSPDLFVDSSKEALSQFSAIYDSNREVFDKLIAKITPDKIQILISIVDNSRKKSKFALMDVYIPRTDDPTDPNIIIDQVLEQVQYTNPLGAYISSAEPTLVRPALVSGLLSRIADYIHNGMPNGSILPLTAHETHALGVAFQNFSSIFVDMAIDRDAAAHLSAVVAMGIHKSRVH